MLGIGDKSTILFAIILSLSLFGLSEAFADHMIAEVKNAPGSSVPGCEETNECFIPYTVTIDVGGTVTWINDDTAAHTFTSGTPGGESVGAIFDSGLVLVDGSFSYTFDAAGEYPYHCMVHPWMSGLVIVEAEQEPEPEPELEFEYPPANDLGIEFVGQPSIYRDDDGTTVLQGQIKNQKDFSIKAVKIWAGFYGFDEDEAIESTVGTTTKDVITTNEISSFVIKSPTPNPNIIRGSVNLLGYNSEPGPPPIGPPITVSTDRSSYSSGDTIRISGFIATLNENYDQPLLLRITDPGNNIMTIQQFLPSADGTFSHPITQTETWQLSGTYRVIVNYGALEASNTFTFTASGGTTAPPPPPPTPEPEPEPEPELKMPSVLKQIAGDWANGLISDYEFLQQVQILINQGKLILPGVDTGGPGGSTGLIPDWIRNNAGWWADGLISDEDFANGLEFLFQQNILPVTITDEPYPTPEPEPTPTPTPITPLFITTDQSSYKPGNTVKISGEGAAKSENIIITILSPQGREVTELTTRSTKAGYFETLWIIPSRIESGTYTIRVDDLRNTATTSFRIISDTVPPPPPPSPTPGTDVIMPQGTSVPGCEETNECFIPFMVRTEVGETITWFNQDSAAHTVTSGTPGDAESVGAIFDSSLVMVDGSFSHTFDREGTFDYFCMVHPWMAGLVLVGEGTSPPPVPPPSNIQISVDTDRSLYDLGDLVSVTVKISGTSTSQNVAISVEDPTGKAVVSRTLTTDRLGRATMEFGIHENFKTGGYTVTANARIGGITYHDTTHFKIESQFDQVRIVSVAGTDQQGNPASFTRGELGFVKVVVSANKNITTLITVNLFDSELTTIGIASFRTTLATGESEMILSFLIPEDAAPGAADIFTNAFSDWPSNGGIPLTGEFSTQVRIT